MNDTHLLNVKIENIKKMQGQIWVAVYNQEEHFLGDTTIAKGVKKVDQSSELIIEIPDLPYGSYAISIFHDKNSNDKLDTGLFGIPKEPYGFSNNVRPKFSAPKYKDALFDFTEDRQTVSITIK